MEKCICNFTDSDMESSDAGEVDGPNWDDSVRVVEESKVINIGEQNPDKHQINGSDMRGERVPKADPAPNQTDGLTEAGGGSKKKTLPCQIKRNRLKGTLP